jgi:hypothetical protein
VRECFTIMMTITSSPGSYHELEFNARCDDYLIHLLRVTMYERLMGGVMTICFIS